MRRQGAKGIVGELDRSRHLWRSGFEVEHPNVKRKNIRVASTLLDCDARAVWGPSRGPLVGVADGQPRDHFRLEVHDVDAGGPWNRFVMSGKVIRSVEHLATRERDPLTVG